MPGLITGCGRRLQQGERHTMRPRDNRLATNLGVVVFSSPLEEGAGRADQASLDVVRRLEAAGHKTLHAGAVDTPDKAVSAGRRLAEAHVHAVVMVAACWFEDYLALDLIEECRVPLLLWSLPGMRDRGALRHPAVDLRAGRAGDRVRDGPRRRHRRTPRAADRTIRPGRVAALSPASIAHRIGRPARRRHVRCHGRTSWR